MTNAPQQPPAGWYPDPAGTDAERFWDGVAWSQATRDKAVYTPPTPAEPQQWQQPGSPQGYGEPMSYGASRPAGPRPAAFGWRLLGFILDNILVAVVANLVSGVVGLNAAMDAAINRWMREFEIWADSGAMDSPPLPDSGFWALSFYSTLVVLVVYAIYRTVLLGTLSATLGQLALGLRTVKAGEGPESKLGWGAAAARGIAGAVLYNLPLVGLVNGLMAVFTPAKQTLSDMMSKTQVLKIR